ncbi:MAG: DUF4150 domain-containing protein [Myxococcota bacterium]|nr:DUF4150 domain-containing protein [Myxococcota bacterium]
MFANTQMGGLDFAFPDICKIPPAAIPIPFPNFALGPMGVPPCPKVLFACAPAHNLATVIPTSFGDEPGVLGGIISQTIKGPSRHLTASFTTLVGGLPATRLTSVTLQNLCNAIGMRIVPSQVKVLLLAP